MQRFIKVRVRNMDLMKGSKNRDIYTNNADGTNVTIQDGVEVELTEYAYNNLKDAIQVIMKQGAKDPNNLKAPAPLISTLHPKVDIVEMTPFYTKDENGNIVMPETKTEKTIQDLEAEIARLKQKFTDQDKRKDDFEKEKEFKSIDPVIAIKDELGIGLNPTEEQKQEFVKLYNERVNNSEDITPLLTPEEQAIVNKPLWGTKETEAGILHT